MVETVALVISRTGTSVEVEARPPGCRRCAAGRGCGAGLLASNAPRRFTALLPSGIDVHPGDGVSVAFDGRSLQRAVLCSYGLPLAGLVAGAAFAGLAGMTDGAAVLLGATGLAAGAGGGRVLAHRPGCAGRLHPVIVGRAVAPQRGPATP